MSGRTSTIFATSCRMWQEFHANHNNLGRAIIYALLVKRYGQERVLRHAYQIAEAIDKIENETRIK
jgi:hypothetical protein